VSEHLKVGFACSVFAWSPPLDAFVALKISKNGLEVRKLWPFEIEGGEGGERGSFLQKILH